MEKKQYALDPNHSSAFNLLAQAYNFLIFESSAQDKREKMIKNLESIQKKHFS